MLDVHCHVLYGVDDGARDKDESFDMLETAKKDASGMTANFFSDERKAANTIVKRGMANYIVTMPTELSITNIIRSIYQRSKS